MSELNPEPIFNTLRLRERERDGVARVFDVSDSRNPKYVGDAVNFFGTAEEKTVPGISFQWLTEITVVAEPSQQAEIEAAAAERKRNRPGDPPLSLVHAYSCSAVGANTRILKGDLQDIEKTFSYIIVDEADPGNGAKMRVKEIWIAECDNPKGSCQLTPASVKGKTLLSPGKEQDLVQWEAIAFRVANRS